MTTGAIIALCVSVLLLGLGGVFFIIWFFFRRSKQEDDAVRSWQAQTMSRIDELFPSLEQLLREGARVPAPVAESERATAACARHQDDADAATQREIEESNRIGEAERVIEVGRSGSGTLFGDGGGFVS
ncbi:MAG: hypothetical protein LBK47_08465 [Prevotellaceae bacterium]|jgi:glutathione S-transferase|nr:hypothetical protein [Prevotellaceae bacterium]